MKEAIGSAIASFARDDPGRSVALMSLGEVDVAAELRVDAVRPAASLMKLPLAAAVWEAGATGQVDLDAAVAVDELPTTKNRSILAVLAPEHRFTIRELCGLCISMSDNRAAQHLLGLAGIDAVNAVLRSWGCDASRCAVGFEDDSLGERGRANVTTARDALTIVRRIHEEPRYRELALAAANTAHNLRIRARLPLDVRVVHKTGTLPGVCNDAGIVSCRSGDLALAFLCDGQRDVAACGLAIGDCVLTVRRALGDPE